MNTFQFITFTNILNPGWSEYDKKKSLWKAYRWVSLYWWTRKRRKFGYQPKTYSSNFRFINSNAMSLSTNQQSFLHPNYTCKFAKCVSNEINYSVFAKKKKIVYGNFVTFNGRPRGTSALENRSMNLVWNNCGVTWCSFFKRGHSMWSLIY